MRSNGQTPNFPHPSHGNHFLHSGTPGKAFEPWPISSVTWWLFRSRILVTQNDQKKKRSKIDIINCIVHQMIHVHHLLVVSCGTFLKLTCHSSICFLSQLPSERPDLFCRTRLPLEPLAWHWKSLSPPESNSEWINHKNVVKKQGNTPK